MTIYSDDAIFHYTDTAGLLGILSQEEIWSTAYFTTNDISELNAGEGILTQIVNESTLALVLANHDYMNTFQKRGDNISDYASNFESLFFKATMNILQIYITCFCKSSEKDFQDGLLSQWRGYGRNGGYALEFSRSKLMEWMRNTNQNTGKYSYSLNDVHYVLDNPRKEQVLEYKDSYLEIYMNYLNCMANQEQVPAQSNEPIDMASIMASIISSTQLAGEAIHQFLFYRLLTKNRHFSEERECRMSAVVTMPFDGIQFLNKNGMLVPYIKTPPPSKSFLDCIKGIIVGPGAYQDVRFHSVNRLLMSKGLDLKVRRSSIPYIDS